MMNDEKLLTADELFGILDNPEDNRSFILNLEKAREERAIEIMKKYDDLK